MPHARTHQQRGRLQRARTDDHLARADVECFPRTAYSDADGTPAVEQYPLGLRLRHDREIGPAPYICGQVAPCSTHAAGVRMAISDARVAVRKHAILILPIGPTVPLDRRDDAADEARPGVLAQTLQANRTVRTVHRTIEIAVGLQLPEIGQYAFPVPPARAQRGPSLIVRRQATVGRHAVDRRCSAYDAALVVKAPRPAVGRIARSGAKARGDVGPDEPRIGICSGGEDIEDFLRFLTGRVVLACLDQQHAVAGSLAQA